MAEGKVKEQAELEREETLGRRPRKEAQCAQEGTVRPRVPSLLRK